MADRQSVDVASLSHALVCGIREPANVAQCGSAWHVGHGAPLCGTAHVPEVGAAFLLHLHVVRAGGRVGAHHSVAASDVREQHPGGWRLAAIFQSAVVGTSVKAGHVVSGRVAVGAIAQLAPADIIRPPRSNPALGQHTAPRSAEITSRWRRVVARFRWAFVGLECVPAGIVFAQTRIGAGGYGALVLGSAVEKIVVTDLSASCR